MLYFLVLYLYFFCILCDLFIFIHNIHTLRIHYILYILFILFILFHMETNSKISHWKNLLPPQLRIIMP
jgi:hypothetical protein